MIDERGNDLTRILVSYANQCGAGSAYAQILELFAQEAKT